MVILRLISLLALVAVLASCESQQTATQIKQEPQKTEADQMKEKAAADAKAAAEAKAKAEQEAKAKAEQEAKVKAEQEAKSKAEAEAAAKFDWSKAEVTEENVKKALSTVKEDAVTTIGFNDKVFRKYVDIPDAKGHYPSVNIKQDDFLDEKDFVRRAAGTFLAYSRVMFQNPQVYEFSITFLIDASNALGEKKEIEGVWLSWRRDNVKDIDWDKLLDSDNFVLNYRKPYQLARQYTINKDLYDKLPADFGLPRDKDPSH
jgi:hypothetical protein